MMNLFHSLLSSI